MAANQLDEIRSFSIGAQAPTALSPIDLPYQGGLTPLNERPEEKLTPHKGHFHTETGQKVAGPGVKNAAGEMMYEHKGHFHAGAAGRKLSGSTPLASGEKGALPTDEDVVQEGIAEQRRQIRARGGRGRMSTIMHGKAGNMLG